MSEKLPESYPYENHESAFCTDIGFLPIGESAGGKKITAKRLKGGDGRILLIGGVHGNETEGVAFMEGFCREFMKSEKAAMAFDIYAVPVLNPDGFLRKERRNGNGVDLNRNLPTKDWTSEVAEEKYFPGTEAGSEPENKLLMEILADFQPQYIISFHSWKPMINVNGPAQPHAEKIHSLLEYIITDDIGYPTPGSLGTFSGWERQIPTITLEFPRGIALEKIYPAARDAMVASFDLVKSR